MEYFNLVTHTFGAVNRGNLPIAIQLLIPHSETLNKPSKLKLVKKLQDIMTQIPLIIVSNFQFDGADI